MNFNRHSELEGKHAILSPSNYSWTKYDLEKMEAVYRNKLNVARGTKIHEFAAQAIDLGEKLPRSKKTLNMYVNDSIGYRQKPEQKLFYSWNCFGTSDSINFNNNILRIFDLKTGFTPAHMEQLMIYAALFCLEYGIDPHKIDMDLRIYQNDDIFQDDPDPDDIEEIMEDIKTKDKLLKEIDMEVGNNAFNY